MQAAERVFFDYLVRENVSLPTPTGGKSHAARRLVFSLDGLGIGDAARRAMASATGKALQGTHIRPDNVQFIVPHQAGTGIVRLTEMKLDEFGVHGPHWRLEELTSRYSDGLPIRRSAGAGSRQKMVSLPARRGFSDTKRVRRSSRGQAVAGV